jgi:pSer/pThr/pTyr-binding forkhead associated (FHA) protein
MKDTAWACLVRIKTDEGYRSHLIEKSSFTIGRTQDADLPFIQQGVSRNHLAVDIGQDKIIITDRASANGTFVNEKRLLPNVPTEVSASDIVKLGLTGNHLSFCATTKPYEFLDFDKQKESLIKSLDKVAREFEAKARE